MRSISSKTETPLFLAFLVKPWTELRSAIFGLISRGVILHVILTNKNVSHKWNKEILSDFEWNNKVKYRSMETPCLGAPVGKSSECNSN